MPSGLRTLYGGPQGIWSSDPDGKFLTKLTDLGIDSQDLRRARSPRGDHLALIVSNDQGLDLVEVKIPGGETKTIAHLYSITSDEVATNPTSARAFTYYALRNFDNVAWQPGSGKLLAFMGAMDGPTSDLYVYNTDNGEVTRLTNGPSQAIFPTWSWDGKYILHFGVSWRGPFGGAILGPDHLDGIWSVHVEDGEVITLPKPKSVTLNFVDWQDATHYITYDSDENCFYKNLHSVDITDGKIAPIMDASFSEIAYSPSYQSFLFTGTEGCSTSIGEGIFLLSTREPTPTKLSDKKAYEINWVNDSQAFFAYPEAFFAADGTQLYEPAVYDKSYHPAISFSGYQAWEVIENQKGRVVVRTPDSDWKSILMAKSQSWRGIRFPAKRC